MSDLKQHKCEQMPNYLVIFQKPTGGWWLSCDNLKAEVEGSNHQEVTWCFLCGKSLIGGCNKDPRPDYLQPIIPNQKEQGNDSA